MCGKRREKVDQFFIELLYDGKHKTTDERMNERANVRLLVRPDSGTYHVTVVVTLNRLHISPSTYMHIYAHCLFSMLFLSSISTAYHLLSGSRAARLLLN